MVTLLHFLPLVFFFAAYKLYEIYTATLFLMASSVICFPCSWLIQRKINTSDVITLSFILLFGTATVFFKNPLFIKWKVSIIFWLLGTGILINYLLKNQAASYTLLNEKIDMRDKDWYRVDLMIIMYSFFMGSLNWIIFNFLSESTWVNFKTFGLLVASIAFSIIVAFFVSQKAEAIR